MIIGQSIHNILALTYLLKTENPFDSRVPVYGLVWTLEQRVVDKAINEWHGRLRTCVRANGQHFEHLLWAANFSFGLILLSNFANMHFMIGTLSNCCLLCKVQLQHVKPGWCAERRKNFVTKFFWHVSAKNYQIRMASGKLVANSKKVTF